jgi:dTMP kinase
MNTGRGLFITFEGGEGCGKSTQARVLHRRLTELALSAILIHEPGMTDIGEKVGRCLKWAQQTSISPLTELMLFNASRAQLVTEVIQPVLNDGKIVVCDRFADSTTAYQGYGRGLDLDEVKRVNSIAMQGVKPDMTILLDIPAEIGLDRKRGRKHDRFEQEKLAFHRRVREGYLHLAAAEPERWLLIDARLGKTRIAAIIWEQVERRLSRHETK